jgi:hypothetical protein
MNPVVTFFDLEQPCPPEIPLCRELREKYIQDVQTASAKHCKKCELTSIKAKYTTVVWEQYMEHMTSKGKKQDAIL